MELYRTMLCTAKIVMKYKQKNLTLFCKLMFLHGVARCAFKENDIKSFISV